MKKFLPSLFIAIAAQQLCAQSLDLTFGINGYVKEALSSNEDTAKAQAIQADGKIVVAGFQDNGTNEDIVVIRYNVNGTLDNSFATDGSLTISLASSDERACGIALQTDGKIIVAGSTNTSGTNDFLVCRINTDGTLDNSFDTDGIAITDNIRMSTGSSNEKAKSLAIQADGKIVLVGTGFSADQVEGVYDEYAVVRYNTDGTLDNSFSVDGKLTIGVGDIDEGNDAAIQADGKIVIVGTSRDGNTQLYQAAIIRLNTDGTLDTDFDTDGKLLTSHTSNNSALEALVTDTSITVVGHFDGDYAIQRFKADGSVDAAFDTDGLTTADVANPTSFTIQADGKFLVAGYTTGINNQIAIARFNKNGSLDNTFGVNGILTFNSIGYIQAATSIGLDSDERIVVSGYAQSLISITGSDYLTIRFTNVITSVSKPELANVSFYPNPTTSAVNLDLGEMGKEIQVEISNSIGTKLNAYTFAQTQNIDLEIDGPQGIYFLNISKDGQSKQIKIVKQ